MKYQEVIDKVRDRIRTKHYSYSTEKAYVGSAGGVRSPMDMVA